jgi:hypothetical protein
MPFVAGGKDAGQRHARHGSAEGGYLLHRALRFGAALVDG